MIPLSQSLELTFQSLQLFVRKNLGFEVEENEANVRVDSKEQLLQENLLFLQRVLEREVENQHHCKSLRNQGILHEPLGCSAGDFVDQSVEVVVLNEVSVFPEDVVDVFVQKETFGHSVDEVLLLKEQLEV